MWAARLRVVLLYIQPGNPLGNAYIKCYNRTVRYASLAIDPFNDIQHSQDISTR